MNKLRQALAVLALCGIVHAAPAQDRGQKGQVVQDGIAVKPLKGGFLRDLLAPEGKMDKEAGQQYTALLGQAQQKGVLVPAGDPQVKRLRAIAQRIIPHTARWNQDAQQWKWQVNLLQSDQVNAFCMPGGRIAFFTGIIDKLRLTDDEIAAVMGHEIAHALREHGRDRQAKATTTGVASSVIGAAISAYTGYDLRGLANTAGQLYVLKFSRDEEREADLVGLDIAARAGYDPRAGIALWNKMAALNQRGAPIELLSTHPGGAHRIEQIQSHMNVLLPLYARSRNTSVDRLPAYRSTQTGSNGAVR
ncbi:Beta-barrel assembly-enhancing protease [Massilia sp. Bi118]|uniref:M48 family metallopeptidase n=1 Tax=Massilia sp. Bi118 TaxID=2822346 RepID=UPI001DAC6417|nr:M48 family metallopeptidase [Massilia sp. Bi118]CAH0151915.1 Beta-barrel assembly-enhancing protease [Massilia sp. Bi118]